MGICLILPAPAASPRFSSGLSIAAPARAWLAWREETARVKRRMYRDEDYWGRPLAAFGDPNARLLVVGLAPAAHGGNRTGRMFTGDRQRRLAVWRAAPGRVRQSARIRPRRRRAGTAGRAGYGGGPLRPAAKQTDAGRAGRLPSPISSGSWSCWPICGPWSPWVGVAFDALLRGLGAAGRTMPPRKPPFGHNVATPTADGGPLLIACYHPSQQNTQTGRPHAGDAG